MNNKLINTLFFVISAVLLQILTSCIYEQLPGAEETGKYEDGIIRISAYIDNDKPTRTQGYFQSGPITSGKWGFICSPKFIEEDCLGIFAEVNFDNPEDPGVGYVTYINSKGKRKELKYDDILTGSAPNHFTSYHAYMHNIDRTEFDGVYEVQSGNNTYTYPYFDFSDGRYNAAPLDKINGTNDLLCGMPDEMTFALTRPDVLPVNLKHLFSLLKVNISVFGGMDNVIYVNLDNAEVYIDNVNPNTDGFYLNYIYNRDTPGVVFVYPEKDDKNKEAQRIYLRKPSENKETNNWDWEIEPQPGNDDEIKRYSTQDIVCPPQSFSTTEIRPRLVVKVPKKDVTGVESDEGYREFSGWLPLVMISGTGNNDFESSIGSPDEDITTQNLEFKSGARLILNATINSPDTEITFASAELVDWYFLGSNGDLSVHQAGIFKEQDFYDWINAYNSKDYTALEKYGYLYDGIYIFQLWGAISLDKDRISGAISDVHLPFRFDFNQYSIPVITADGQEQILSGNEGHNDLYNIVTDSDRPKPQIKNSEDFMRMLKAIQEGDTETLCKYGTVYTYLNEWQFEITGSFPVNFEDMYQKIDPETFPYYMNFIFDNNQIEIKFTEDFSIVQSADQNKELINRLSTKKETGIQDSQDFLWLKYFYNNVYASYNDILELFGEKNEENTWIFKVLSDIYITMEDAAGSLPVNGIDKPNFYFEEAGNNYKFVYISYGDNKRDSFPTFSESLSIYYLYLILSGTGEYRYLSNRNLTSSYSNLISYYQNKNLLHLWEYGTFDYSSNRWNFVMNNSNISHSYEGLKGKMIPDIENGFYDFSFELKDDFIVTNLPRLDGTSGTQTVTLSGEEGAMILYKIFTDTYEQE